MIIRPLHGTDECRAAVQLQEEIWGEGFSERVPASLLHVLPRVGAVALGAFLPEGRVVGLAFGVTGVEGGRIVHWSDMVGVHPAHRDAGLGRRLKFAQREAARATGATRMYWTADPLEARNAWFNVEVLGATSTEYHIDFYGPSDSPLHEGIGTDRLIMHWDLEPPISTSGAAVPEAATSGLDAPQEWIRVAVPGNLQALKSRALERAVAWRVRVREMLTSAFEAGGELRGVARNSDSVELLVSPGPSAPPR